MDSDNNIQMDYDINNEIKNKNKIVTINQKKYFKYRKRKKNTFKRKKKIFGILVTILKILKMIII